MAETSKAETSKAETPDSSIPDPPGKTGSQELDPKLMEILVCPESKAKLVRQGDWLVSTDPATRRRYPIREGIPIMLIDESEVLSEEEHRKIMDHAEKEND